ncbi:hypothetical protein IKQ26_08610 [bacterium]|nr:hypothetical protein [bacterium]
MITLVIIGVIAAITVPTLMNKFQEEQTISKLTSTYSILSQAVKMAEIHNGKIETWDIGTGDSPEGAIKLYNYIAPEIKKLKSCGSDTGCFADTYKNLQGNNAPYNPNTWNRYARGILNNGTSFIIWSSGSNCNLNLSINNNGSLSRTCGAFLVDINGNKKPNRYGYDYFCFYITKDGLLPSGTKDFIARSWTGQTDCQHSSTKTENGLACTAWVLYKRNFDYKHRDISWDE